MVRKLIKYDFRYYLLPLIFIEGGMLLFAVILKVFSLFKSDTTLYMAMYSSLMIVFIIALAAAVIVTEVLAVVRFYKNLYSSEGYLTFTLPVTHHQIIISKLITSVLVMTLVTVTAILCAMIQLPREAYSEIFSVQAYTYGTEYSLAGAETYKIVLVYIEFFVFFIVGAAGNLMQIYACETIGQLAKKNRILLSVGVYFGIYFVTQILASIVMILFAAGTVGAMMTNQGAIYNIMEKAVENPLAATQVFFGIAIAISIGLFFVYYFITANIMKKKLNLE